MTVSSPSKCPRSGTVSRFRKMNSSCSLVSSLAMQTSRAPKRVYRYFRVSAILSLRSKKTRVEKIFAYGARVFSMSLVFRGKKPKKVKGLGAMPLPAKAVTGADAPGMAVTGMFFSRQALTIKYPGSEMTGMPASEISAISSPCCKKFRACSNFFFAVVVEADKALGFKPPAGEIQSRPFGVFGKHEGNFF